jgi:hypothetical protein
MTDGHPGYHLPLKGQLLEHPPKGWNIQPYCGRETGKQNLAWTSKEETDSVK